MKRNALLLACVLLLGAALWARDDHMVNSTLVPAARGNVSTDTDRNGNTSIKISVEHLARPHDLQPSFASYVVWVEPSGQAPVNIGELRVNGDLHGTLETRTPYKNFDIRVTAESNPRVETPTGPEVLHASINRD